MGVTLKKPIVEANHNADNRFGLPLAAVLFYIQSIIIPQVASGMLFQITSIILWLFPIYIIFRKKPRERVYKWKIVFISLTFALSYILIQGFANGLGWNPLSYEPRIYLLNLTWLLTLAVGMEAYRRILLDRFPGKKPIIVFASTIFFMILLTPFQSVLGVEGGRSIFSLVTQKIQLFYILLIAGIINSTLGFKSASLFAAVTRGILVLAPILPVVGGYSQLFTSTLAMMLAIGTFSMLVQEGGSALPGKGSFLILLGILTISWMSSGALGYYPVVITSGSMTPTINIGDIVVVRKVTLDQTEPGDIILFKTEQGLVLHRIQTITMENGKLTATTKGDANPERDPWIITDNMLIGKAVFKLPKAGKITIYIRSTLTS
jgi:signal peptidase